MTVALGLECNRAGFSSLLTTDFPRDRRQMASGWGHNCLHHSSHLRGASSPGGLQDLKLGPCRGHSSRWTPSDRKYLCIAKSCLEAVARDVGLYVPAHTHPPAAVKPEPCFIGIHRLGLSADIHFCQGLTGTLSLSHQKTFLDQQLLFVK